MMKIDEGVLYIDEAVEDENIDELLAVVSQDDIEKIELATDTIDPASMQVLLCRSKNTYVEANDEYIQSLFENLKKD